MSAAPRGGSTCFVIMPFGEKPSGSGGRIIDFDLVHRDLIKAALQQVPELHSLRCDEIERPGWIHERMLEHIFLSGAAVVDLSALNANVFYELGVRHALRRGITVLIQESGTSTPFNLAGMDVIRYEATPEGLAAAVPKLVRYLRNALDGPAETDSLVHKALPQLRVQRLQRQAPLAPPLCWWLRDGAGDDGTPLRVGLVTGDRRDLADIADVWVNSENTQMQMDGIYGKSTSATIRYLGARRNEAGVVVEDCIADQLRHKLRDLGLSAVDAGTVLETGPGALRDDLGVQRVLHVAAVVGQPLQGWRPVHDLAACVRAVLRKSLDGGSRAVLMPIFGTGPGGGELEPTFELLLATAVEFLTQPRTRKGSLRDVLFYVWGEDDLAQCRAIADGHAALLPPA